ncbi:hypothetical protein [Comamonas sp. JC664]|uniref:hypothetical protein n=1 Tax=Comamonas sp. JC664 TaxID=2801917 RepID=UPI0036218173
MTQSAAVVMNTQGHATGAVEASASSNLVGAATASATNATLVVSGNQFSASAASQKADNLARINATNGVVDSGAIVVNVQDHQAGNVGATVADFINVSPAPQPAPMLIGLRADTASGASLTVTGNQGASDAIVNQANNQVSIAGSRIDGSSAAILYNAQNVSSGNAQSLTWVNLGVDGNTVADTTRAGGHELVVSNNQFSANASQTSRQQPGDERRQHAGNGRPAAGTAGQRADLGRRHLGDHADGHPQRQQCGYRCQRQHHHHGQPGQQHGACQRRQQPADAGCRHAGERPVCVAGQFAGQHRCRHLDHQLAGRWQCCQPA